MKKKQQKYVEETSIGIGELNSNPELYEQKGYEKTSKLAIIEHPKHPGDEKYKGTGIAFGVSQIMGTDSIDSVLTAADQKVELIKN